MAVSGGRRGFNGLDEEKGIPPTENISPRLASKNRIGFFSSRVSLCIAYCRT